MSITKEGLFKYHELNERQRKNLMILETLRKKSPISKADLSKQLGYNTDVLSNYIDEYIKNGLVYEKGVETSSPGKRPALMDLNKEENFLIGIDFSKGGLRGVLTDFALNIIKEETLTRPSIEQGEVEKGLILLIGDLIKNSKINASKIRTISIGTYGAIAETNMAIKGLDEEKGRSRATIYFTELKQAIEKRFNIKTFFGADAPFAAFGERAKNPNPDVDNMLYIYQDVGKGVVVKGEIYCSTDIGSVDTEGVIGNIEHEERAKLREETPYLRPWNSKMSLRNEAMKVIERGVGTKIVELLKGNLESLNDEVIMKAATQQDDIAIELIEGIGINLGVRIAYLINLFSPKIVVIGGGIEKSGDILFKQIERTIEKLSLEKMKNTVKILPSIMGEKAVSLGAASVALREVFLEA